ncbi:MAG: YegP family protein [Saprospiraceae bacterium]
MKFEIFQSETSDKFYFRLKAGNGQIILSSQAYASKASCKNGVESVKTNAASDANFERKEAANGKFHFNLLAANKQIVGSSQMYASKATMENGIQSVMTTAPQASVEDLTGGKE